MSTARVILDRGIPEVLEDDDVIIIDLDFPDAVVDEFDIRQGISTLQAAAKHDFPDWVLQRIAEYCRTGIDDLELGPDFRKSFLAEINKILPSSLA